MSSLHTFFTPEILYHPGHGYNYTKLLFPKRNLFSLPLQALTNSKTQRDNFPIVLTQHLLASCLSPQNLLQITFEKKLGSLGQPVFNFKIPEVGCIYLLKPISTIQIFKQFFQNETLAILFKNKEDVSQRRFLKKIFSNKTSLLIIRSPKFISPLYISNNNYAKNQNRLFENDS